MEILNSPIKANGHLILFIFLQRMIGATIIGCVIIVSGWQTKADHLLWLADGRQRLLLAYQIVVAIAVVVVVVGTISAIRYTIVWHLDGIRMVMLSSAGNSQRITIIVICTIA